VSCRSGTGASRSPGGRAYRKAQGGKNCAADNLYAVRYRTVSCVRDSPRKNMCLVSVKPRRHQGIHTAPPASKRQL
jgi:hypothetical protein